MTQAQIAELFGTGRQAITKHLKNIFSSEELEENSVCSILELTASDGKVYKTKVYNLDAILSVGYRVNSKNATLFRYRVNSKNATLFRQWANKVLKEYLLKGYSINQRLRELEQNVNDKLMQHENRLNAIDKKIDFFVRTSLPPVEGIFFNGQIFDAYKFATDIIKYARKSILLIDNYIDESVLLMLSKRGSNVSATIYTQKITPQFQLDLEKHNEQYPQIDIRTYRNCHDRFLIIDNNDVVLHSRIWVRKCLLSQNWKSLQK